ncbi:MAG: IS1595 family transposase, partial [Holosporaceae bacterium]|nr:IS1595 family transposase [Holosporaceae bacterium]MDR0632032.1 IS1595 family transposase [Holosporaceae bacterium]MDR0632033.1 IS1595 family transposase [Holosporaceae bacterium]
EKFYLHLKETEWRFNHGHENIYKLLLNRLRKSPL